MRNLTFLILLIAALSSCQTGDNGELTGVMGRPEYYQETPLGMMLIPEGSFQMGVSGQDVASAHDSRTKTVSVQAFYMDDTEISNNEYRQFVNYVKDSLIRKFAADEGIIGYDQEEWFRQYDAYDIALTDAPHELDEEDFPINWESKFEWANLKDIGGDGEAKMTILDEFYLRGAENYYGRTELDARKMMFDYWWIDFKRAASRERRVQEGKAESLGVTNKLGQDNFVHGHTDKSEFIIEEHINIYPDTLTWVHDFTYAFNEPMTEAYFWHPAYDNYPVVGVTWKQAIAFCYWRTQYKNDFLSGYGEPIVHRFRLPTEAEWEFASRGGLDISMYPWGSPYIRNAEGCFLANFKPMRGRYKEDGGMVPVKVDTYHPNNYGLYNMAGNVSEWTSTAYDESVYNFSHDLNAEYAYDALASDPTYLKRKVIRGGSWKDFGYYIQTGARTFEFQDTSKCYIGFRTIQSYLGRPESPIN